MQKQQKHFTICGSSKAFGIFSPSIDLDGCLAISFRPDPVFASGLNVPGIFTGTIELVQK